ncbi:hypothetical protein [Peribacillus glennii]|uniref:hypothetical protein n=1 Tax=Peribacillus glennii TaxID=2303991 RepID=UPI001313E829|nr:hypothetical protein [Peribacillus glennii]
MIPSKLKKPIVWGAVITALVLGVFFLVGGYNGLAGRLRYINLSVYLGFKC